MVSSRDELGIIAKIGAKLKSLGYHAGNSTIVTVSPDYSAMFGQIIRHKLSHNGEICQGFSIEVPYPDQYWDETYIHDIKQQVLSNMHQIKYTNCILVEAAIIRGGNYTTIVDYITSKFNEAKIVTVAMYENVHSKFKSNIVGEYYDDNTQDLTFWWEEENNHWITKKP